MAIVEDVLPTLLTSRPRGVAEDLGKRRRRPAPAELDIPEDAAIESRALPGVSTSTTTFRVKNTFIESAVPQSPSMEAFFRERVIQTCPSKNAGRIANSLEDISVDVPSSTPCNIETPLAVGLPSSHYAAAWGGVRPLWWGSALGEGLAPHLVGATLATQPCAPGEVLDARKPRGYARPVLSLESALLPEVSSVPLVAHGIGARAQFFPEGHVATVPGTTAGTVFCPATTSRRISAGGAALESDIPPPPPGPAPGSEEMPSMGSAEHELGTCKPCAFLHTKGCNNGIACRFCHLCGPEERRRRQKEKIQLLKEERRQRKG